MAHNNLSRSSWFPKDAGFDGSLSDLCSLLQTFLSPIGIILRFDLDYSGSLWYIVIVYSNMIVVRIYS